MTRFSAHNHSTASLRSSRKEVWEALTDPVLLPRLTPYLERIDVDGDLWVWHLAHIPVLGGSIGTTFTEVMTFEEPERITFTHDETREESSSVEGSYFLEEAGSGCRVTIDLEVVVDLPFPRVARGAVQAGMATVMAGMGRRFASNLLRHLGEK